MSERGEGDVELENGDRFNGMQLRIALAVVLLESTTGNEVAETYHTARGHSSKVAKLRSELHR